MDDLTSIALGIGSTCMGLGAICLLGAFILLIGWIWQEALVLWAKNFNSTTAKTKLWLEFCRYKKLKKGV